MKILLYGEALQPGSGVWCYHDTLGRMGHEVEHFDSSAALEHYLSDPLWRGYQRLTRRVAERHRREHARRLIARAAELRPEIVFVLKGLFLGPDDVLALKKTGAWVINVNHDDFFSRNRANRSAVQRSAIPGWDFVFATRAVNVDEVRPRNPNVELFRFAYHPEIHRPVPLTPGDRETWEVDAVFVGTWERERCALLERLVQQVPGRYAIWGDQWDRAGGSSPLRPYIRARSVHLDDMARALGGAKMSLGFLRKKNRDLYTQRSFEIPACGGVLLAERTPDHLSFYREGIEAEFFDPDAPAELCDKVRRLLAHDEEREAMRRAGREAVLRGRHSYRDRLERLLELYESRDRRSSSSAVALDA